MEIIANYGPGVPVGALAISVMVILPIAIGLNFSFRNPIRIAFYLSLFQLSCGVIACGFHYTGRDPYRLDADGAFVLALDFIFPFTICLAVGWIVNLVMGKPSKS